MNQTKRYTGHQYDEETDLSYMGARYYDGERSQFVSQDPVFLSAGSWATVQEKTGDKLGFYLKNPQTHNSYGYAANNPLRYEDQNGEYLESVVDVAFIAYDLYKVGHALAIGGNVKAELGYLGLDIAGLAVPAGTGFGMAGRVAAKGGDEFAQLQSIARQNNWGNAGTLTDHTRRHSGDFGITSAANYAKFGNEFRSKIGTKGVDSFTDNSGVTRVYEKSTNTFASYNKNGTTRTIYKPNPSEHGYRTNQEYWNAQKK
jgi:RHS repeat-associated protein